jgi:hypothetical protein
MTTQMIISRDNGAVLVENIKAAGARKAFNARVRALRMDDDAHDVSRLTLMQDGKTVAVAEWREKGTDAAFFMMRGA